MRSLLPHRAAHALRSPVGGLRWHPVHLTLGIGVVLVSLVLATSRLVTAQPPQTPPDRITLRSPDGRSEVVIAVSDSGVLKISLAPRGEIRQGRLPKPVSLRLLAGREPALELRDDRERVVGVLGGPLFRRVE